MRAMRWLGRVIKTYSAKFREISHAEYTVHTYKEEALNLYDFVKNDKNIHDMQIHSLQNITTTDECTQDSEVGSVTAFFVFHEWSKNSWFWLFWCSENAWNTKLSVVCDVHTDSASCIRKRLSFIMTWRFPFSGIPL